MQHSLIFALAPHVSEGELKTPSVSIPKGTIVAVFYTFTVYALLFILVSATCDRSEMANHFSYESFSNHQHSDRHVVPMRLMPFIYFSQDPVDSGLWVLPENKPVVSVCYYRDILRLSVSCNVRYDWSVSYPACSRTGSPFW